MRDLEFADYGPGATREEIARLESELGVKFPLDYVEFVLKYAGSSNPTKSDFPVPEVGEAGFGVLLEIEPHEQDGTNYYEDIRTIIRELDHDDILPKRVVPVVFGAGGESVCIDFRELEPKIVFLWPSFMYGKEEKTIPLSNSFTEFLDKLHEPDCEI